LLQIPQFLHGNARAVPRPLIYSFTNPKEPDLLSRTGFGYTGTVYECAHCVAEVVI